jgi:hypothetical protein
MKARGPKNKKRAKASARQDQPKRGRGRPREFEDPVTISLRLERLELDRIHDWATEHGQTLSDTIRTAIDGLVS